MNNQGKQLYDLLKRFPIKITMLYVFFGSLWIIASDIVVHGFQDYNRSFPNVEVYKGLFFIFSTGVLLFLMTNYYAKRIEETEKALLKSEESFRLFVENAEDILFRFIFNSKPAFLFISPSVENITGHSPKYFYAYPELLFELIHEEDREEFKSFVLHPNHQTHYFRFINKEGSLKHLSLRAVPINNKQGEIIGIEGIARDVTERKMHESIIAKKNEELKIYATHLEETNKKLMKLEQIKNEFLANVSHELRTPLNAVLGFSQLIKEGLFEDPDELLEFINIIEKNGTDLLTIIDDILTLSKLESDKLDLTISHFSLQDILQELRDYVEGQALASSLTITTHSIEKEVIIKSDYGKVREVLRHLLRNAIKFTEEGQITVKADLVEDEVLFSIIDTGIGIDPEKQALLFQKFVQADGTSTRKFGGLGIGLTICQLTIHKLSGKIEIYSDGLNKGTKVYVTLPLVAKK
ncbi:PAS domain S-box protein [Heliorestis acidaminivorans]|uniref:histidine kinase n=1 Tax=Heliorestis acidaminivorans TaxID=553427 RepID=A0A6I0F2K8_9FIRM|nr:PAS domain-containing sensor histidine kinase [Heliorestis acidaminivorans]KAB2952703.1 PAS domain S-box protein [Heliorestis acidaminivorans]